MLNIWTIDGEVTIKKNCMNAAKKVLKSYGCNIDSETKNQIIFSFRKGISESDVSEMIESLTDVVSNGKVSVFDEDEGAYGIYTLHNGICEYANGMPLMYYLGHEEQFVDSLPKILVDAVLKKYGNGREV